MQYKKVLMSLIALGCVIAPTTYSAFAQTDNKSDLVYSVHNFSGNWWESIFVDKLMTYNLSPSGWEKMKTEKGRGTDTATRAARYMMEFCKKLGMEDADRMESANHDRAASKPNVEALADKMKEKVGYTLDAANIQFDDTKWELTNRYMLTIISEYKDSRFKPKGDAAIITQTMSTTAKDISVACPDGKHFAITCPVNSEPSAWDDKIIKGMLRFSK